MPRLRAFAILVAFLIVTFGSIPWQLYAMHFRLKRRKTFPTRFHRILAKLFGLRITVIGTPVQDCGVLMVANHTGYLDILILSATVRVSFVAKSEVKSWPLFGLMAQLQESVFVERGRRIQAGEARHQLRERLRAGDALVLFPEGTSTDGNRVLTFKSSLLGAAESDVGVDDAGHSIEVVDPLREQLMAAAARQAQEPTAFLAQREIFGDLVDDPRFTDAYLRALASLHTMGALATVDAWSVRPTS